MNRKQRRKDIKAAIHGKNVAQETLREHAQEIYQAGMADCIHIVRALLYKGINDTGCPVETNPYELYKGFEKLRNFVGYDDWLSEMIKDEEAMKELNKFVEDFKVSANKKKEEKKEDDTRGDEKNDN